MPADNATGNFIPIAERVPFRIGLDAEELRKIPLQAGLSTLTRIKTSEPGKPLLTSTAETVGSAYRTPIYDYELGEAEQLIDNTIAENIVISPNESTISR